MVSSTGHNFPSRTAHARLTLGERIRIARRSAGLSQAALAERCSITASAVAQWEHPGGTRPVLARLKAIAKSLKVPVEWLISGGSLISVKAQENHETEPPAVILDEYAQTAQEEELLVAFRRMGYQARGHLLSLAQEFSIPRRRGA